MSVDYVGCGVCGDGVYEEYIAETECCGRSVCSYCVINTEDVEGDGAYIYPFYISDDGYIDKKYCPFCSEKDLNKLLDRYDKIFEESKKLGKNILERLKNKTLPLDDRWKIYEKFANTYPDFEIGVGCSFDSIDNDKRLYYDNFNIDRYQTAYILNMIEIIKEYENGLNEFKEREYEIDIDKFKEEVLNIGITGFRSDW